MSSREITTGSKDYVSRASVLFGEAFAADASLNYICGSLSREERLAYLPTCFKIFLNATLLTPSTINEIGDFQSCGVLVPPGYHPLTPMREAEAILRSGFYDMLWTLRWGGYGRITSLSHPARDLKNATFANGETYYYIFLLGTSPSARGKGLCSEIIKHYQAIARAANKPIWLEAGNEYCMGLYRKNGFVIVEELKLAVGKADARGEMKEGGEGFSIWGMIWRPDEEDVGGNKVVR